VRQFGISADNRAFGDPKLFVNRVASLQHTVDELLQHRPKQRLPTLRDHTRALVLILGSQFAILCGQVNSLLFVVALSVVGNSSEPSLRVLWASAASHSTASELSSFAPQGRFEGIPTFDFVHSLGLLVERQSARGRGKWNGWMATDWLRLHVALMGGSHSGGEVGGTAILSHSWLSPTVTAEAGHSSGGDAFSRVRVLTKSPYLDPALIRGYIYDYQAAYAGLELGAQSFAISINVGVLRAENAYLNIQSPEAAAFNPVPGVQCTRSAQLGPAAKLALLIRM